MAFKAYGHPLIIVSFFKYLVRVIADSDGYWLVLVYDLSNSRNKWDQLSHILGL